MYNSTPYTPPGGLGISLKPPDWLRRIVGDVVGGTRISVPPVTVPLPGGGSATINPTRPTFQQQTQQIVGAVPGGWLTIAAIAAGAIFILPRLMGRRGR
jgi:hypothetical protein